MAACSSLLADPQGLCPRSVDLEFTPAQRAELSQNLARRGCWKLSTWQPPAQGFSLLAVAAGGCPGERLGREQLQMRLSAPLSQESRPAPAEAPASPCRAGSCRSTLLGRGSAAGSPALGPCPALHGSMRWVWVARGPCVLPAAACRVRRSRTAGTQQRRQTASKHQDFCFPFTAVVPHSFAFFAKGLPLLCVKALNS